MYASVGKVAILKDNIATSQAFYNMVFDDEISKNYVYHYLKKMEITNSWDEFISKGTQANLNAETIKNYKIYLPISNEERQKYSELLFAINNLITLHQRKHKKLLNVKRAFINLLMVKNKSTWVQRKLGNVTKRVQGNDGRMDLPTLTISAGNGWLDQRDRFSANIAGKEQENYTLLHEGELSYNHGNSKIAKYGAVFSLRTYKEALVPRVYHSFKVTNEANANFIEYMFSTKVPDSELRKLISSSARMDGLLNINYNEFMSINIMIPSTMVQQKIGTYLRIFDRIITLHQRKVEKLEKIKKSLLKNMFL